MSETTQHERPQTRWDRIGMDVLVARVGHGEQRWCAIDVHIEASPLSGMVTLTPDPLTPANYLELTPDEARLYGVRLIEAAALAAGGREVREP